MRGRKASTRSKNPKGRLHVADQRLVFQVPIREVGYCQIFLPNAPLRDCDFDWLERGIHMVFNNLKEPPDWTAFGLPMAGTKALA